MRSTLFLIPLLLGASFSAASEQAPTFTLDGRLYTLSTGSPLEDTVSFRIQILNGAKSCVLYEELQSQTTTSGFFNLKIGSANVNDPKRGPGDSHNPMSLVFQNTKSIAATGCASPYSPVPGEGRYARITVTQTNGDTRTLSPDLLIDSVPSSYVAETLQGRSPTDFIQANTIPELTQSAVEDLVRGDSLLYLRNDANGAPLPNRSSDPLLGNLSPGQIWFDSSGVIKFFNGTSIQTLGVSGSGITSVATGTGLTGGPITSSGTISIANGGVGTTQLATNAVTTAKIQDANVTGAKLEDVAGLVTGSYGTSKAVPTITVDAKGRVTSATSTPIAALDGGVITTGTIDVARLPPAATLWQDGGAGKIYRNGGEVGIGTATPDYTLDVNRDGGAYSDMVRIQNRNSAGGSTILYADNTGATQAFTGYGNPGLGGPFASTFFFATNSHPLSFFTDETGVGDGVVRMTIKPSTGNVGIGTADPQSKLDVNGTLRVPTICDQNGANCKTVSSGWGSGGSVTSVATGTGLTGGPITTSGTISIAPGGVGATELATNAVTTAKIADGNVTGVKLETLAGLSTGTYGSATAIPAVTIDTKGRVTAITTNNITGLLPSAGGASGKYLKSDGTSWAGANITFGDLKNSVGASAFNAGIGACAANQTVKWSSLTDMFECQDIGGLDAAKITTGTIDPARLPPSATLWQDGGAGKIYYNSGNVGIGTSTPAEQLDVSGSVNAALRATVTNSNAGSGAYAMMKAVSNNTSIAMYATSTAGGGQAVISSPGAIYYDVNSSNSHIFRNGAGPTERMRIDPSGNVGIGTNSPSARLNIIDNTNSATVRLQNTAAGNSSSIGFRDSAGNNKGYLEWANSGYSGLSGGNAFSVFTLDADPLSFGTANTERLRISGAGNVGIGTVNPQARLDVNGTLRVPTICDETGANCKTISSGWGSGGSVTSVATGTGLTGGPITGSGTISIAAGGVGATELATNAVTTAKITDGNVTTAKIADGNVTGVKLETLAGLSTGTYGSATAIPAVTIDTKGRITAITTNNVTGLLPAAGGASGKYLKSDGTNWAGANVTFSDIKNSVGGSAFNLAGCAANQTVSWSSLTDMFTCQNIGSLDGAAITSGTIASARLPAGASMWQDGGSGKIYYNAGNIGVGTNNPANRLHLISGSDGSDTVRLERTAANLAASIKYVPSGALNIGNVTYYQGMQPNSNNFSLNTWDGTTWKEPMTLSPFGNIGIGTTSPSSKLDVTTAGASSNETGFVLQNPSTLAYSTVNFDFRTAGAWRGSFWTMRANTGLGGVFGISTADSSGVGQERLRMIENGNVGIGTSTPVERLQVSGGSIATSDNFFFKQTNSASNLFNAVKMQPFVYTSTAGSEGSGLGFIVKNAGADSYAVDISDRLFSYIPFESQGNWSYFKRSGNNSFGPFIYGMKSRGTFTAPTAVQSGDDLLTIAASGYDSPTTMKDGAYIYMRATQNFTSTSAGTKMIFSTTPNGSTSPLDRMTIDQNGNVGVGTSAPASPLDVSTTYAGATDMNAVKTLAVWSPSSAPSGAWYVGNSNEIQSGGSANMSNASMEAVWGQTTHMRTGTLNNARGGEFQVNNSAAGSINDARGTASTVSNGSSGSIASAAGAVGLVTNKGGGTISQAYGVQANVDNTSGTIAAAYGLKTWFSNAGTITNGYGVYIDTVSGTNKFGLYQSDSANPNYFAGNVGIGIASPGYKLHVVGTAGLSTGTAWTNASDIRLKDIDGEYEYGLDEILKLRTVRYHYKKDNPLGIPSDHAMTGVIAQEVKDVIPDAIHTREDGYLELNIDPIHWAVVNAIKDLWNRWTADREKTDREIASLKEENAAMKAYLCGKDPQAPFCRK